MLVLLVGVEFQNVRLLMNDATSRYFLFGLLTIWSPECDVFLNTWFRVRALGAETFGMILLLSSFPVELLGSFNFSLIPFLFPILTHYMNLEHYWLLEFHFPFALDFYSLHYFWTFWTGALFWTFWSWALFTPFCIPLFWTPLFTLWLGLWFPTVLFTLVLGILFPTALFTLEHFLSYTLVNHFLLVASVLQNTEDGFLGTLPFGLGCATSTTFGIPASFKCILFLLLSPSSVDTTYDLGGLRPWTWHQPCTIVWSRYSVPTYAVCVGAVTAPWHKHHGWYNLAWIEGMLWLIGCWLEAW